MLKWQGYCSPVIFFGRQKVKGFYRKGRKVTQSKTKNMEWMMQWLMANAFLHY